VQFFGCTISNIFFFCKDFLDRKSFGFYTCIFYKKKQNTHQHFKKEKRSSKHMSLETFFSLFFFLHLKKKKNKEKNVFLSK
jgi:hypothetical protein